MSSERFYRILDANFNRSREGLRVCEEITRFILEDARLTRKLKAARHSVSRLLPKFPNQALLGSRDSAGDVGKDASKLERKRAGASGLFAANIQRAKEALRVLEETSKLAESKLAPAFKKIRFEVYQIEKEIIPKLEALCGHGPRRGGRTPDRADRGPSSPGRGGRRSIKR